MIRPHGLRLGRLCFEPARPACTDEGAAEHAEQLAREGLHSKAAAALEQGELAPVSEDTHSKLHALHPDGSRSGDMPAAPNPAPQPPPLDPGQVHKGATRKTVILLMKQHTKQLFVSASF